ncbi:hypothetical protein C8046_10380 [Serinibacter arcticus]|uniref:Uncharacterized protein n=1 Tax=Serinibacter arcticus TaxID=1655435 RepID=A0A2U1ZZU0_9MICO|nr:hypothetical protein C8046_10380 [Serinibacter arcticus]
MELDVGTEHLAVEGERVAGGAGQVEVRRHRGHGGHRRAGRGRCGTPSREVRNPLAGGAEPPRGWCRNPSAVWWGGGVSTSNDPPVRSVRRAPDPERRSRVGLALVGLVIVALGLVGRFALPGAAGDVAGGLLYAALVYVVVAMVVPRASGTRIALVALAVVLGVELLQLTGVPAAIGEAFPPARLVLGTTFVVSDLVIGAVGVALMATTDAVLARPRGSR